MRIPKPNEWDSNLCINSGTEITFGDLYNIAVKNQENNEKLIEALKYADKFASRDDSYDKEYIQNLINSITKNK